MDTRQSGNMLEMYNIGRAKDSGKDGKQKGSRDARNIFRI
jgi:hypothetical protein